MNKKKVIYLIALVPFGFLSAQFSTDFTSAEGYNNEVLGSGATNGSANASDWNYFENSSTPDPNTFTVDTSGSGSLVIDRTQSDGFQVATYTGSGTPLVSNNYSGVIDFSLSFTNGSSALHSVTPFLPQIQYNNVNNSEGVSYGLRYINTNSFNFASLANFNGPNQSEFSNQIAGATIGLSVDGSDNWLDGQSDALSLAFNAEYLGKNGSNIDEWNMTTVLTNLDTSTIIQTISGVATDTDGSFATADQRLRLIPASDMTSYEVAINVDSLSVAIPEPGSFACLAGLGALGFVALRRRRCR